MPIEQNYRCVDNQFVHNREAIANSLLYRLLWPTEIVDPSNQMEQAKDFLCSGGSILGIFSHKKMSDGPILALSLLRNSEFRFHRLLFPIAYHQYESHFKPVLKYYSKKLGIELFPLVIRDTLRRKRYKHLQRGAGMVSYAKNSVSALKENSVVFLSPQEGRRPTLGRAEVPALGLLVGLAQKSGVDLTNVGILPLDITEKGYSIIPNSGKGLTLFKTSIMTIGNVVPLSDAVYQAKEKFGTQKEGDVNPIDHWGFSQLEQIVPEWYR